MGPFRVATVAVSAAFLLAGIVWPQAAEAFLRLFLAALAVGFVLARAYAAMLPGRSSQDSYSPFDGSDNTGPHLAPTVVHRLAAEIDAVDRPRRSRRTPIPRSVRWRVMDEAARRLADHHGLDLDDPTDHAAIRSIVSEPTWRLIGALEPGTRPGTRAAAARSAVPLSRLTFILDELERL